MQLLEDNTTMEVKITSFAPKDDLAPRWITAFESGNILRFTGKFALEEQPPHNMLEASINLIK